MGDRGNIGIKMGDDKRVYLYTHWGGSEVPEVLERALAKRWRWDDAPYLARIIFEELIGDQKGTETGFGIDSQPAGDCEHAIPTLDCEAQQVKLRPSSNRGVKFTISFEDWAAGKWRGPWTQMEGGDE